MFELFFRTLWRAVLNLGPVKPKHKQIFKKACQRVRKNNSKILKRSGYFRVTNKPKLYILPGWWLLSITVLNSRFLFGGCNFGRFGDILRIGIVIQICGIDFTKVLGV